MYNVHTVMYNLYSNVQCIYSNVQCTYSRVVIESVIARAKYIDTILYTKVKTTLKQH